ncbi:MAG TPA: hypothetical protein VIQ26_07135 [Microbacteriaceae bacterium]|jgi:hypothetical protein
MNDIDPSATEPPPTEPIDITAIMDRLAELDRHGELDGSGMTE